MSVALTSLAVASLWISVSSVDADRVKSPQEQQRRQVTVVVDDGNGGEDQQARVEVANNDGRSEKRVVRLTATAPGDADQHGWLGVSIGSISDTESGDLNVGENGTVILDVVQNSPADRAGLAAHDVVLSIGGEDTDGDIGRLVDLVSSHKPGEEVEVVVLRDGEEKSFVVPLGSRADAKGFQWKFDLKPLGEMKEKIRAHAHVLRPGEDGDLILEELGDLNDLKVLKDLPHGIRAFIPESDDRTVQVWVDKDHQGVKKIIQKIDGKSLEITQKDGGDIVVKRTDEDGNETEDTYADEAALQDGDDEAYKAFAESGDQATFKFDMNWDQTGGLPRLEFKFDTDEWRHAFNNWHDELEQNLSEAQAAHKEAMNSLNDAIEQWKSGKGPELPGALARLPGILAELDPVQDVHPFAHARYSFRVDEDGKIEARLRKGDSEIIRSFSDEDDLADRDPKLYDKYMKMMAEDDAQ